MTTLYVDLSVDCASSSSLGILLEARVLKSCCLPNDSVGSNNHVHRSQIFRCQQENLLAFKKTRVSVPSPVRSEKPTLSLQHHEFRICFPFMNMVCETGT